MEKKNKLITITLIDPFWEGHHCVYIKLFSKALLEMGLRVQVFCPKPDVARRWVELNCTSLSGQFLAHKFIYPGGKKKLSMPYIGPYIDPFVDAFKMWLYTVKKIRPEMVESKKNRVFFLWLDSYLGPGVGRVIIDSIFPYKWSGLYFHPNHLRLTNNSVLGKILDPSAALRSDNCASVAILDEGMKSKLAKNLGHRKKIVIFPDVTDESESLKYYRLASDVIKKARGRPVIGSLGSIEKRKGSLVLMRIARADRSNKLFFLFQGPFCEQTFSESELKEVKSFIRSKPENCLFIMREIPDGKRFNALVKVCDLLYLAYLNFYHSSNLLTKAALLKKLVLVSEGYCMAERVDKYDMGIVVKVDNINEQLKAIQSILRGVGINNHILKPKYISYLENNSFGKLKKSLSEVLGQFS